MKTESKAKIEMVKRLAELQAIVKEATKEADKLKDYFKCELEFSKILEAGDYVVMLEDASTTSFKREELQIELGDKLQQFIKVTNYTKILVRKAA